MPEMENVFEFLSLKRESMSGTVELLYAPANPTNPVEIAKRALIASLERLPAPSISVTPQPEQIEAVAEFIRAIAACGDACMRAVGAEVKANAATAVDLDVFQSPFTDAVDGNATYEIERLAEDLREEYAQAACEWRAWR